MSAHFVLSQEVSDQCSGDYLAIKRVRTAVVSGDLTIAQAFEWGRYHGLGSGNVVITQSEDQKGAAT